MSDQMHILLVEDDEVDLMTIKRAFKKNNLINPLHIARDGIEALEMLRGEGGKEKLNPTPQIVLLDLNMPRMGGIEFLKEIRADEALKSLSVFVLTTSADDNDKINAFNLNVAGYVLKPVNFENFVKAVGTMNAYWQLCESPSND